MSNKKDEALKLALEGAANYIDALGGDSCKYRQALAEQPAPVAKAHKQQDPVLWLVNGVIQASDIPKDYTGCLFTSPPAQRKPLTDEELRAIENKINPNMRWRSSDEEGITLYPIEYYELVRAIEAAHGIKENT